MEGKLFFEGEGRIRAITNYVVLLTLATIIATYGVISGSTATVIGAMIIAPLMTPIMATTLAIVLGESPRMSRSVGVVCLNRDPFFDQPEHALDDFLVFHGAQENLPWRHVYCKEHKNNHLIWLASFKVMHGNQFSQPGYGRTFPEQLLPARIVTLVV